MPRPRRRRRRGSDRRRHLQRWRDTDSTSNSAIWGFTGPRHDVAEYLDANGWQLRQDAVARVTGRDGLPSRARQYPIGAH